MQTRYAFVEVVSGGLYTSSSVTYYHIMPGRLSTNTGTTTTNQDQFIEDLADERRRNVRIVSDRLPFGVKHIGSITCEDGHNTPIRRETWKDFYIEMYGRR